jgi:hypothetical protein
MKFNSSLTVAVASAVLGLTTFDVMPTQAATLTQDHVSLQGLMFKKFDSEIGTLNQVTFNYKWEIKTVWDLVDQYQFPCGASGTDIKTGKFAECEVGWDLHLLGLNGLEGFSDETIGLVEISHSGQKLNFGLEGSFIPQNISLFVGNNNQRVGWLGGRESYFSYYPQLTPLVSHEVIRKYTLTYEYTPNSTESVPEPTTNAGVVMSILGLGMLLKKKKMFSKVTLDK